MGVSKYVETRKKLREIPEVETFNALINRCTLSDEDKYIVVQHNLHGVSLDELSKELNWSYVTIKRRHNKAVAKLKPLITE